MSVNSCLQPAPSTTHHTAMTQNSHSNKEAFIKHLFKSVVNTEITNQLLILKAEFIVTDGEYAFHMQNN